MEKMDIETEKKTQDAEWTYFFYNNKKKSK